MLVAETLLSSRRHLLLWLEPEIVYGLPYT